MQLRIGDCIRWKTYGNGKSNIRSGKILAVVPSRYNARFVVDAICKESSIYDPKAIGTTTPRPHETYIVGVIGDRRVELFWPRVISIIEVLPTGVASC